MENTEENTEQSWPPPWPTLDGVPIEEWVARKSRPREFVEYDAAGKEAVEEIVMPDHFFSCFPDLDVLL